MTTYIIHKSSRLPVIPLSVVTRNSYQLNRLPQTRYEELRSGVYDTLEAAQAAADEAKQYNPVGFHVLILEEVKS